MERIKMQIPQYIDRQIDKMRESKKKQAWQQLKETDNVYVIIPTIDSLNFRKEHLKGNMRMKTLDALKYSSSYYHYVNGIYQKYDYILNNDFYESVIHPNEYDAIYVTEKTRKNANKICEGIDKRIEELEKKN